MTNELLAHCIRERAKGRRIDLAYIKQMCHRLDGVHVSDSVALEILIKANAKRPKMIRQEESGIVHWRLSACAKQNHAS